MSEASNTWLATSVSPAWLDRVVAARRRLKSTDGQFHRLKMLLNRGDMDFSTYTEGAEAIFEQGGTHYRYNALRRRHGGIVDQLTSIEHLGGRIGGVEIALTELEEVLNETLLNTEAALAELQPDDDPQYDRLEEHPAYERD